MKATHMPEIGIAAIAIYEPPLKLGNEWFGGDIPSKFVHHTGIVSRPISQADEVSMAINAAQKLQAETDCDWSECGGIIFSSPSFVPTNVANRCGDVDTVQQERLPSAARRFANYLGVVNRPVHAINWFCSGFAKAISIVFRSTNSSLQLEQNQFLLVVTASRISRITDYGCKQTGALFGDMATATLISRTGSPFYKPRFRILFANADRYATDGAFFDFHLRRNVVSPGHDGQRLINDQRLVFSLNGMAIADSAPRAMSSALTDAVQATGLTANELQFVVPHQAGTGIVRLAAMKMESAGFRGHVINGITSTVGNVSSCSIPYALKQTWNELDGYIACPTAAVGHPGRAEMSQGCTILQTIPSRRAWSHTAWVNSTTSKSVRQRTDAVAAPISKLIAEAAKTNW